jgi:hypothetical protein
VSGVLVDLTSQGDYWKKDPDLTPPQAAVVRGLVRRQRPLVGGLRIVGPIVGTTQSGSSINTGSSSGATHSACSSKMRSRRTWRTG